MASKISDSILILPNVIGEKLHTIKRFFKTAKKERYYYVKLESTCFIEHNRYFYGDQFEKQTSSLRLN